MYFSHFWLNPVAAKSRISKGTLKNVFSVAKLYYGLPRWCSGKEPTCNAGDARDAGLIPGLERSPRGGSGNPFQYSCLENSMDRGAWWATVHGVTKSQRGLSTHVSHLSHQVMSRGTSILKRCLYFHSPFPGVCGTLCNQDPHFTEVLSNCLM